MLELHFAPDVECRRVSDVTRVWSDGKRSYTPTKPMLLPTSNRCPRKLIIGVRVRIWARARRAVRSCSRAIAAMSAIPAPGHVALVDTTDLGPEQVQRPDGLAAHPRRDRLHRTQPPSELPRRRGPAGDRFLATIRCKRIAVATLDRLQRRNPASRDRGQIGRIVLRTASPPRENFDAPRPGRHRGAPTSG